MSITAILIVALLLFVLMTGGYLLFQRKRKRTLAPLVSGEYNFGKRRDTFRRVMDLMEKRGAKVLIETGVARAGLANSKSDGASTIVFGLWAKKNSARLYSVDINAESIEIASRQCAQMGIDGNIEFAVSDSVEWLTHFKQQVDFLYLDSYDYDKHDKAEQQISQQHHLRELQAIESRLHEQSVVLIDDCQLQGGGKGKLVIDYMRNQGWYVDTNAYQVILMPAEAR